MKNTINDQLGGKSDGSTIVTLKGEKIPQNKMVCIQRIVVRNLDSNSTYVFVRCVRGAGSTYIGMIETTNAPKLYSDNDPVFLKDCRRIELDFYATSSGDDLEAYIYGYYVT